MINVFVILEWLEQCATQTSLIVNRNRVLTMVRSYKLELEVSHFYTWILFFYWGKCIEQINGFLCQCAPGFTGSRCSKRLCSLTNCSQSMNSLKYCSTNFFLSNNVRRSCIVFDSPFISDVECQCESDRQSPIWVLCQIKSTLRSSNQTDRIEFYAQTNRNNWNNDQI